MAYKVSNAELRSFYSIDRELYIRLVTVLRLNRYEANRVIAFWLWLERMGMPSMAVMLRAAPDIIVRAAAREALMCLVCMEWAILPEEVTGDAIPITSRILGGHVSLDFLHRNRKFARGAIAQTMAEVCARALADIMQDAANLQTVSSAGQIPFRNTHMNAKWGGMPGYVAPRNIPYMNLGLHPRFQPSLHYPRFQPSLHYPRFQPSLHIRDAPPVPTKMQPLLPRPPSPWMNPQHALTNPYFEIGESSSSRSRGNPANRNIRFDAPPDRSMFMTFSRGYVVSREELWAYLFWRYGDVVEEISMSDRSSGMQPLFAIVAFRSPADVEGILNENEQVKFVVNGKHVICRRWVPRD